MKGVTLISDVFLIICLLSIIVIMTLFIWALIMIHQVEYKLYPTPRTVELKLFFRPVNYDAIMSAFLEYENEGITMKKILNAVAIQGKTDIWLDGKPINAKAVSEGFLTPQINKDYLLKIGEITVAESRTLSSETVLGLQKVSTELFLLNGEKVYLQLFVRD